MLAPLASTFQISFIDAIGMDPRHPPTEGWPHLIDQLVSELEPLDRKSVV